MSRVADALRRRLGDATTSDAVPEDEHPWVLLGTASGPERLHHVVEPVVLPRKPVTEEADAIHLDPRWARRLDSDPPQPAVAVSKDEQALRRQLASLVQRVFLVSHPPACVGFVPVGTRDGVAALAATAATVVSEHVDGTVCVMDLDLTAPSLHRVLNVPVAPGAANAIGTGASLIDVARQLRPNLWVIPAGDVSGLLREPHMARDLGSLRSSFDFVLVAFEPQTGPHVLPTVSGVDGVILVIDADATRRETARQVTDLLHRAGTAVLGAVLTNRRYPIPDAVYRHL